MSDLRNIAHPPTEPTALDEFLREQYSDLVARRDELVADAALAIPEAIEDDTQKARVVQWGKDASEFADKIAERAREQAKAPFLAAGKRVDGFFKETLLGGTSAAGLLKLIATARQLIRDRLIKEEQERRAEERRKAEAAEAERRRLEAEARKAQRKEERAAERTGVEPAGVTRSDELRAAASVMGERAQQSQQLATAKASELVRTRTDQGAVATLAEVWEAELSDPDQVPRKYMTVDMKLVNATVREAVRAGTIEQLRIPGITIRKSRQSRIA